jgi:hypothetical protein
LQSDIFRFRIGYQEGVGWEAMRNRKPQNETDFLTDEKLKTRKIENPYVSPSYVVGCVLEFPKCVGGGKRMRDAAEGRNNEIDYGNASSSELVACCFPTT